jgi:hypothetical protein
MFWCCLPLKFKDHWLNLKNCCVLERRFVAVFSPLMTTGDRETVVQPAAGPRLVVDCKMNLMPLVGHVRATFSGVGVIISCGG